MRRRQFIVGFGGLAALPLAAWAQQGRRVGVLMAFDEYDSEGKRYLSEFTQGLAELGWTDGRNLRVDVRWGAGNVDRMRIVAFRWKDYRIDGPQRWKTMTLHPHEFIRRFLTHVLPKGFHRIRHYGLFASSNRAA